MALFLLILVTHRSLTFLKGKFTYEQTAVLASSCGACGTRLSLSLMMHQSRPEFILLIFFYILALHLFNFKRGRSGLSETEKPRKKSPKTAKHFVQNRKPNKTPDSQSFASSKSIFLLLIFIRVNLFYFPRFFQVIVSAEHIVA